MQQQQYNVDHRVGLMTCEFSRGILQKKMNKNVTLQHRVLVITLFFRSRQWSDNETVQWNEWKQCQDGGELCCLQQSTCARKGGGGFLLELVLFNHKPTNVSAA